MPLGSALQLLLPALLPLPSLHYLSRCMMLAGQNASRWAEKEQPTSAIAEAVAETVPG